LASRRYALRVLAAGVIALIAGVASAITPFATTIDGVFYDISLAVRHALNGSEAPEELSKNARSAALVVAIDERTLASQHAQAPRAMFSPLFAKVVQKALNSGAKNVMFDVVLEFDAARLNLEGVPLPPSLKQFDTPFLELLKTHASDGRIVLARTAKALPADRFNWMAGADGIAFAELPIDPDGVVRGIIQKINTDDGQSFPTLTGKAMASAGIEISGLHLLAPATRLSAAIPSASMIDVLNCHDAEALTDLFSARTVIIGSVLPDEDRLVGPDRFMVEPVNQATGKPCDFLSVDARGENPRTTPGVFFHAASIETLTKGQAAAPLSRGLLLAAGFVSAFASSIIAIFAVPALAGGIIAVLGVGLFALSISLLEVGLAYPLGRSVLIVLVAFAGGWGTKVFLLERRTRRLQKSFGLYLAPQIVERLADAPEMPRLDGETRSISVMFADLSGFTKLSETTDSQTLTDTINRYLSIIAKEVDESGGYVDKFIGDAVMAIWNAPAEREDHSLAAVEAALAIERVVTEAASKDRALGGVGFDIKIGINTGPATVGNVGSANRLSYSAIGEAVNIAARLESLPPKFGVRILVGPETAAAVNDDFLMLAVADVLVRGKLDPVVIWTPLSRNAEASKFLEAYVGEYGLALQAFRAGEFDRAKDIWQRLSNEDWIAASIAECMIGIVEEARSQCNANGWLGALVV